MENFLILCCAPLLLLLLTASTLNEANYRSKKYGKTVENIEVKEVKEEKQQKHTHVMNARVLYTSKMKITIGSTNISNLLQCCYPFPS